MGGKFLTRRIALAGSCLLAVGCDQGTVPERAASIDLLAASGATRDAGQPVIDFVTGELISGASSSLIRTRHGVNYQLKTSDLEPGHAYTLWIVIFNDPGGCLDGTPGVTSCGPMDVVNAAARPDMMYAAGSLVGGSGSATFSGRRDVADPSGSANAPVGLPAFGLEDAFSAEIHFVVHHHGPKLAAYLPDMIQTIDGGCTDAGVPEAAAASPWNEYSGDPGIGAFGRRGPNTCASVQAAAHVP